MQRRARKRRDDPADSTDCTSWPRLERMHPKLAALLPHWPDKTVNPLTTPLDLASSPPPPPPPSPPPLCQMRLSLGLLSRQVDPSNLVKLRLGGQLNAIVPDLPGMLFSVLQIVSPDRAECAIDSSVMVPSSLATKYRAFSDTTGRSHSSSQHAIKFDPAANNVTGTEECSPRHGGQVQHVLTDLAELPAE